MRIRTLGIVFILLILTPLASDVQAQIPHVLAWQGVALDSVGQPVVDSAYTMHFSIWNANVGGDSLWGEDHAVLTENGVVSVQLSNVPDSVFADSLAYLQIQFGNDAPYVPRTRIVSVGYSFKTGTVDGATGGDINGSLSVGGGNVLNGVLNFAAGRFHTINANYSTVAGGDSCTVTGDWGVVAGGRFNLAGSTAAVGGGWNNSASNNFTAIGGGQNNSATGAWGMVPGGVGNSAAGGYSFAAGRRAKANHTGCFVWADSTDADFTSTGDEQFLIRATGGVGIGTNAPGFPLEMASGAHVTAGGVWTNASDKRLKENFETVDGEELLEKINQLPIERWNYRNEDESVQHIGPVAQDFYRLFGVGDDDRSISTIDPAGIALAAIQELDRKVERIEELEARLDAMESLVRQLTREKAADERAWEER